MPATPMELVFIIFFGLTLILSSIAIPVAILKIKKLDRYFYSESEEKLDVFISGGWPLSTMRSGEYGLVFFLNFVKNGKFENYFSEKPISDAPRIKFFYILYILNGFNLLLCGAIFYIFIKPD